MGNGLYGLVCLMHKRKLMKQVTQMGVQCSVLLARIYMDHVYGKMAEKKAALFIACVEEKKEGYINQDVQE